MRTGNENIDPGKFYLFSKIILTVGIYSTSNRAMNLR